MRWIRTPFGNVTIAFLVASALSATFVLVLDAPAWAIPIFPVLVSTLVLYARYRHDFKATLDVKRSAESTPWIIAGVSGMIILVLFSLVRWTDIFGPAGNISIQMDLLFLLWLAVLLPPGIFVTAEQKRIRNIEARLPDFLSDLSDSQRSGMSLAAGVRNATKSNYGALSPEVQILADQMSWGVSFDNALKQFADRINTRLVRQTVHLIVEAGRSGGDTTSILHRAAQDIRRAKALEKDRQATMSTYVLVVYVVFFVFLMVLIVLDVQFLPHVLEAGAVGGPTNFDALDPPLTEPDIRFLYFLASMVQAAGTGAVLGSLMSARPPYGFVHGAAMAVCTWIGYRWIVPLMLG